MVSATEAFLNIIPSRPAFSGLFSQHTNESLYIFTMSMAALFFTPPSLVSTSPNFHCNSISASSSTNGNTTSSSKTHTPKPRNSSKSIRIPSPFKTNFNNNPSTNTNKIQSPNPNFSFQSLPSIGSNETIKMPTAPWMSGPLLIPSDEVLDLSKIRKEKNLDSKSKRNEWSLTERIRGGRGKKAMRKIVESITKLKDLEDAEESVKEMEAYEFRVPLEGILNSEVKKMPWETKTQTTVFPRMKKEKVVTAAERELPESVLKKLRGDARKMTQWVKAKKAGVTQDVVDEIKMIWKANELAMIKFNLPLSRYMDRAREIVEFKSKPREQLYICFDGRAVSIGEGEANIVFVFCGLSMLNKSVDHWFQKHYGKFKTGGLVVWSKKDAHVVYRGCHYKSPSKVNLPAEVSSELHSEHSTDEVMCSSKSILSNSKDDNPKYLAESQEIVVDENVSWKGGKGNSSFSCIEENVGLQPVRGTLYEREADRPKYLAESQEIVVDENVSWKGGKGNSSFSCIKENVGLQPVRGALYEREADRPKYLAESQEIVVDENVSWKGGKGNSSFSCIEDNVGLQPVRGTLYEREADRPKYLAESQKIVVDENVSWKGGKGNSSFSCIEENVGLQPVRGTLYERESDRLLDGLGPRFIDWWWPKPLPVDGDLLAEVVPGFRPPFRRCPPRIRRQLADSELTYLRKSARPLPTHFALGRNKKLQGLAAAMIKLWEKSPIVKIAVKCGVPGTDHEQMAWELKRLTGGVLILRNKFIIIFYRGKDFLPPRVENLIANRETELKRCQLQEEGARWKATESLYHTDEIALNCSPIGTVSEFQDIQTKYGYPNNDYVHYDVQHEAEKVTLEKELRKQKRKLFILKVKMERSLKELSKLKSPWGPVELVTDQEIITEEERECFRKIGLKMHRTLVLGRRGVFDGIIGSMHLQWKHREVVKVITMQGSFSQVLDTASVLEIESGGILIAVERLRKGHAIILYRGKNYRRPLKLLSGNLLTKRAALTRSLEMQRTGSLKFFAKQRQLVISDLELKLRDLQRRDENVAPKVS